MSNRPLATFRPAAASALVFLGTLVLGGCSSDVGLTAGPDRTVDQRRKDFPINHDDYARIGYRLDWVGFPSVTGSLPVQYFQGYPDMAVAVEAGSFVTVLESTTGAQRCADQLASYLTKFLGFVRDGHRVYVVSEGEIFTVDTQTCTMVNRQKTARNVGTEPVLFNNLLIFGSVVGEVFAHVAGGSVGGVKAWGFLSSGAFERKPALIGPVVGAVSNTGQVLFLDAQTGGLVGRNTIYSGPSTDPVSDGHLLFVASLDQSIYALSPEGGSTVWRKRTSAPLRVQPTATADRLYCAVPGAGLTAFESGTGNILWTTKGYQGSVIGSNKGRLVAWDGKEAVLLDAARGDIIDRASLPGVAMLKPDQFENGNLYVISKSGVVAPVPAAVI